MTAVIKAEVVIKSRPSCFEFLFSLITKKIIERTKTLFPGSSVNDNDDVFILVSFISIAIIFLVIAFFQSHKVACKKASNNKLNSSCRALASCELQTSFSAFVQPDKHVVQKFDTRKIYQLSNEVIFFAPFFVCFSLFAFKLGATAKVCLRNWFIY